MNLKSIKYNMLENVSQIQKYRAFKLYTINKQI